jgi:hypothetical protein
MNYFIALTAALGLLTTTLAVPLAERQGAQTVHLTFHCGPAEYSMAFPADGTVYSTSEQTPFPCPFPSHPLSQ